MGSIPVHSATINCSGFGIANQIVPNDPMVTGFQSNCTFLSIAEINTPPIFGRKINMPKKAPLDWKPVTIGSFGITWYAMPKPLRLIVAEWMGILPTTGIHMIT